MEVLLWGTGNDPLGPPSLQFPQEGSCSIGEFRPVSANSVVSQETPRCALKA